MLDACEALLLGITSEAARDAVAPVGLGISAPGPVDPQSGILVDPPNLGPAFRGVPLGPELLPSHRVADVAGPRHERGRPRGIGIRRGRRRRGLSLSHGVDRDRWRDLPRWTASSVAGAGWPVSSATSSWTSTVLNAPAARGVTSRRSAPEEPSPARPWRRSPAANPRPSPRRPGATPLTARDVAQTENRGDAVAAGIMTVARRAFAACVVGLVNVFAPLVIIVGGGVAMGQGDRLLQPAREAVARDAFEVAGSGVRIVPATLGDDVGLIGSLPLVRRGRPLSRGVAPAREGAGTGNDPATPPRRTANR